MLIEDNKVVSFEYKLKDAKNGKMLDKSGNGPLSFITGQDAIVPGLEKEIRNYTLGESPRIIVKAADAYGEIEEEAIKILPREQFAGIELQENMIVYGQGSEGETVQVTVKSFTDDEVTVDFNHPLAGRDLLFLVTITEVRDPTPEEATSGQVIPRQDSCGCGSGDDSCGTH